MKGGVQIDEGYLMAGFRKRQSESVIRRADAAAMIGTRDIH